MKRTAANKKAYILISVNFLIGVVLGIVLYYGQKKSGIENNAEELLMLENNLKITDVLRLMRVNLMWFLSIYVASIISPFIFIQPAVLLRGAVNSFCGVYIMQACGIKEAACLILPQCFTTLPVMAMFSVMNIEKQKRIGSEVNKREAISKREIVVMILFAALCAIFETLLFKILFSAFLG